MVPDPRPYGNGDIRRLRILIADDEPTIVTALEKFLTRRGHTVMTAPDADSALVLTASHDFDAALVDARMPGGGLSVVSSLSGDPGFVGPLVLMTGALSTDPDIQVGPEVVRMQKPFRLTELVQIVEGNAQS